MASIETIMWCIAYALGCRPNRAEIRRAKHELADIAPECVDTVIKSTELLLPHMTEQEIILYKRQLCFCTLGAVSYRIAVPVRNRSSSGYCLCPRCAAPLEWDYQSYCDRCGQHLKWRSPRASD